MTRTIWFHRWHDCFTGGQLKHADYFDHVRQTAGFAPRIVFANEPASAAVARERRDLWGARKEELVANWNPKRGDVFFLAGGDWQHLRAHGLDDLRNPRINLIQGVRHAHKGTELFGYLAERAIRICVSPQVADALKGTGQVNGPLLTIPNGINVVPPLILERGAEERRTAGGERLPVFVAGHKRSDLAAKLTERLRQTGIRHTAITGFVERRKFLSLLAQSPVAVVLPGAEEGFYLPALEAMACGCITVTLDCVGNRSFCHHSKNCFVARDTPESLLSVIRTALDMPSSHYDDMLCAAQDTVARHSLVSEREQFQALLANVDDLWREA